MFSARPRFGSWFGGSARHCSQLLCVSWSLRPCSRGGSPPSLRPSRPARCCSAGGWSLLLFGVRRVYRDRREAHEIQNMNILYYLNRSLCAVVSSSRKQIQNVAFCTIDAVVCGYYTTASTAGSLCFSPFSLVSALSVSPSVRFVSAVGAAIMWALACAPPPVSECWLGAVLLRRQRPIHRGASPPSLCGLCSYHTLERGERGVERETISRLWRLKSRKYRHHNRTPVLSAESLFIAIIAKFVIKC